jgi:hypothetical protein
MGQLKRTGLQETGRVHLGALVDRDLAETIRGRYRATLDWYRLEDGLWMLHVLNEGGELVEGGVGDDAVDALLEVYERLIPPT